MSGVLCLAASAAVCQSVTEHARLAQPNGSSLPDCRAYEQVSPVEKNRVDAVGSVGFTQAAANGSAVNYFALSPFPITVGSGAAPSYLSTRYSSNWSTQGVEALAPAGATENVIGITEDDSKTILRVGTEQPNPACEPMLQTCAVEPQESNYYVKDNASGSAQLIAQTSTLEPIVFSDATPGGSRILFETEAKLTPEAAVGVNLYEWDESKPPAERVSLVGLLPGNVTPSRGAVAGPGGPQVGRPVPSFGSGQYYTQHTISKDGSRVVFTDIETGQIYMREPETEKTAPVSAGDEPAYWRATNSDGSYTFYTEGQELYRFSANTSTREQLTVGAKGVTGVLGISDDGSYVYFVAPGVVSGVENLDGQEQEAEEGAANLYVWHEGTITFITKLEQPRLGSPNDEANWRGFSNSGQIEGQGPSGGEKSSRVTPDGRELLFSSKAKQTNYNNNNFTEFYLYSAERPVSEANPFCVTCNPTGRPATSNNTRLTDSNQDLTAEPFSRSAFLTRNLANTGQRVFFETEEALVRGDSNLQTDVYEWEAEGEGSCESHVQNNGCMFLISAGQSTQHSYFGDASTDGNDVFFFTRDALVGQDFDNNADLYDARVDGGFPAQNPPPPPAPCADEATCRDGVSSSVPSVFGSPSSSTFSGPGDLPPQPSSVLGTGGGHGKTAAQIRAEKLAKALKACKAKPKARRKRCEVSARKLYGKVVRPKKKGARR